MNKNLAGGFVALCLLLGPAAASDKKGVTVTYEPEADFSGFRTYAWTEGSQATRPEAQKWIVEAIDRELGRKGFRKVAEAEADFLIASHAFSETGIQAGGAYYKLGGSRDWGVMTFNATDYTVGTLMIDVIDPVAERPVWRATGNALLIDLNPDKVRKKIDKLAKKIFKDYPPG